eukprot:evm.model.NODE_36218_length_14259_cov_19.101690.1
MHSGRFGREELNHLEENRGRGGGGGREGGQGAGAYKIHPFLAALRRGVGGVDDDALSFLEGFQSGKMAFGEGLERVLVNAGVVGEVGVAVGGLPTGGGAEEEDGFLARRRRGREEGRDDRFSMLSCGQV